MLSIDITTGVRDSLETELMRTITQDSIIIQDDQQNEHKHRQHIQTLKTIHNIKTKIQDPKEKITPLRIQLVGNQQPSSSPTTDRERALYNQQEKIKEKQRSQDRVRSIEKYRDRERVKTRSKDYKERDHQKEYNNDKEKEHIKYKDEERRRGRERYAQKEHQDKSKSKSKNKKQDQIEQDAHQRSNSQEAIRTSHSAQNIIGKIRQQRMKYYLSQNIFPENAQLISNQDQFVGPWTSGGHSYSQQDVGEAQLHDNLHPQKYVLPSSSLYLKLHYFLLLKEHQKHCFQTIISLSQSLDLFLVQLLTFDEDDDNDDDKEENDDEDGTRDLEQGGDVDEEKDEEYGFQSSSNPSYDKQEISPDDIEKNLRKLQNLYVVSPRNQSSQRRKIALLHNTNIGQSLVAIPLKKTKTSDTNAPLNKYETERKFRKYDQSNTHSQTSMSLGSY
ncbi:MAG: hypothetical protein EZS28_042366, partial [Streblomastix strix]